MHAYKPNSPDPRLLDSDHEYFGAQSYSINNYEL